ncbi:MAG: hypothetical protein QXV17_06795, partial [Candidatus Micrarchaeaceae archaeon]
FEHPGLELMPVLLHEAIPSIPLIWDFRLLQALAVIGIYAFTLLLAKRIIDYLGISRAYRYGVYIFTVGSSLLMQYTEVIEWRGTEFITAIQLCMVYLLALYYTDYGKGGRGALREELENMILPATLVLAILSVWIWSGGFVNLLALVVAIPMIWLYRFVIKKHPGVWKYVAAGIALGAVILFFAAAPVENMISGFTVHYGLPSCTANPINIGEIQCLNASNGLMLVLMDLVFGAVAIVMLLQDKGLFVSQKSEYEYFIYIILIMALLQLPLAMVYIRALSLIAPYLALLFGFGVVAMFTEFAKRGSNPLVRAIVFLMIAIATIVGMLLFFSASLYLHSQSTPAGLQAIAAYLNINAQNSTVLAYFGYGDYLEAYGHVKVYADTVQELNYSRIEQYDNIFLSSGSSACNLLSAVKPAPQYVLLSPIMKNISIFANASNSSLISNPAGIEQCGYELVKNESGFWLFINNKSKNTYN